MIHGSLNVFAQTRLLSLHLFFVAPQLQSRVVETRRLSLRILTEEEEEKEEEEREIVKRRREKRVDKSITEFDTFAPSWFSE